jgi:hypothetical protein
VKTSFEWLVLNANENPCKENHVTNLVMPKLNTELGDDATDLRTPAKDVGAVLHLHSDLSPV